MLDHIQIISTGESPKSYPGTSPPLSVGSSGDTQELLHQICLGALLGLEAYDLKGNLPAYSSPPY